ncbi:MAG: LCCL domain-containing protein [Oscillospiraceae bacterium]|nr:LCCL domain-containing protein [Oscillospiraceae bacterium]
MKTTKILALAIALIMGFALAACSDSNNNNSGGSTNTPPPSETPSAPEPSAPAPNGAQGNGGNDPGAGGIFNDGSDVQDLGPAPYVVWPMESHRGDPQYFFTAEWDDMLLPEVGENYVVIMEERTDYVTNSDVTIYSLVTFRYIEGADVAGRRMYKTVFPSNEAANEAVDAYAENNVSGFTVVDNVVYGMPFAWPEPPPMERKADIISRAKDTEGMLYFLPEPSGNAAPAPGGNSAGATDPTAYTGTAEHLRGKNDTTHEFYVVGTTSGQVWGSDIYTDDSNIAMAAVHAGVLKDGEAGTVTIRILPGQDSYEGTTRNGVRTASYTLWYGSYEFVS